MRTDFTPYSRGVLAFDEKRRLAFHVSSLRLHVVGMHPGKASLCRVWLTDRHGDRRALREDVPGGRLFAAIADLLIKAGEPLPTEDQWADISAVIS